MCMPDLQKPSDDSSISDEEGVPEEEQSDEDIYHSNSDNDSSSDSSLDDEDVSDDDIEEQEGGDDDDDDDDDEEEENNDGGGGNEDDDEDEEVEEDEEDEVVAAFLSASSDRNRNHPPNLSVGCLIGGFSFHPNTNVIALGLSNGDIAMYKYSNEMNEHLRTNDNVHLKKVMVLEFNETGDYIYSACKDNNVSVSDAETGKMRVYFEKAHTAGSFVTALSFIDENLFATGDEDGVVNVWDIRANGCRFSLKKTEDSINSMITINNSNNQPTLACTSGDGTLTIIDLSTKKMVVQSEPYKSVLTSCVTMKRKTKVVCGTGEGSLITFNTGDFSVFNDEFPCVDKGAAVNRLVPVTENIIISALDNGKIRATNLFPNCHLGIVGHHQDMSVDLLDISDNGHLLASTSYFSSIVKFWNIEFFEDFDLKKHFKKINPKEFNLPSSNVVNATDFFSGLQ
ncbi:WD repeat-containing protein 55 homolog isoform X2 [Rhopalosiphum padi]|uniref:WD repeat-containing protein 55 homolog isoform X2 n=1 Tax=Rhopalosiphum padi TaxID=40932 RepID=UPI00298E195B|nr:WD repeat-containing protein 55 homolog isoform X2 [Rhopalosiphum padi]